MSWTRKKGLDQIGRYCAYQDRSHAEVRRKLGQLGCPWDEIDDVLVTLIEQGFLNEERFARAYTRGKFRMKGWGRIKIQQGLREKQVGEQLIEMALAEEIEETAYWERLRMEVLKKWPQEDPPQFEDWQKIKTQVARKGYEWELLEEMFRELFGK
ncbi:MAG TPA: hypothetical protein ENJ82_03165 [Bacteroidetes bacterium]|nr:hypothetical protein [Bacteroidota bacterium]